MKEGLGHLQFSYGQGQQPTCCAVINTSNTFVAVATAPNQIWLDISGGTSQLQHCGAAANQESGNSCDYRPLARYQKLRFAHVPGMPGMFSQPLQASNPDMHHGMPGSPTTCNFMYLVRGPRGFSWVQAGQGKQLIRRTISKQKNGVIHFSTTKSTEESPFRQN